LVPNRDLNAEALRTGSPLVEVEGSLSAFVRRLNLDTGGRTVRTIKDQLARLSASTIRLGIVHEGRAFTVNSQIVTAFDLWFPTDGRQRMLWPSTVRLSEDYFRSLARHAVPLDESAIRMLAHSAMALDLYAWMAQRLHRIDPGRPAFISWRAVKEQFGFHYGRMRKFREVFEHTLRLVHSQYPAARFEVDERGMTLRHSMPPIKGRLGLISNRPEAPVDQ
jgi:hypothetical protein